MKENVNENLKKTTSSFPKVCGSQAAKQQCQRIVKKQTKLSEILNGFDSEDKRRSDMEIVGDILWVAHFCQFYETSQDMKEILVPYFKEGLTAKEFCMWVTSEPLDI